MVYGCGTLGLLAIAILRMLYPTVEIFAVTRFPHQADLARKFGAHHILDHKPTKKIIETVAQKIGTYSHTPSLGLPMLNDGLNAIYDTVSSPETLEVGVRITRPRGSIILIGVEPPKRFEWTPIYLALQEYLWVEHSTTATKIEQKAGKTGRSASCPLIP